MSTWGFILMAVHLGLHWNMVTGVLMTALKKVNPRTRKILLRIAAAMIAAYGVYDSFTHDIGSKLIMYYGFSFWDPEGSSLLFLADHFAILGLYACASHYSMKWMRIAKRKD